MDTVLFCFGLCILLPGSIVQIPLLESLPFERQICNCLTTSGNTHPSRTSPGSWGKESACNSGDLGSIPGSGRSLGEGNGYPFQYSCLEDSIVRGVFCMFYNFLFRFYHSRQWVIDSYVKKNAANIATFSTNYVIRKWHKQNYIIAGWQYWFNILLKK